MIFWGGGSNGFVTFFIVFKVFLSVVFKFIVFVIKVTCLLVWIISVLLRFVFGVYYFGELSNRRFYFNYVF